MIFLYFNFRSVSISLTSNATNILEFAIWGEAHFEKKLTNLTIYGEIGDKNSMIIRSSELKFFDQIDLDNVLQSEIKNVLGLMNYEHADIFQKNYFIQIEYLIENCSSWEYFSYKNFENGKQM